MVICTTEVRMDGDKTANIEPQQDMHLLRMPFPQNYQFH